MKKKLQISLPFLGLFLIISNTLILILKNQSYWIINKTKIESIETFGKDQKCNLDYISEIPQNSHVIIGHIYGSSSKNSDFIDKKAQNFLIKNNENIKILFLTGDVFFKPSEYKWAKLYNLFGKNIKIIISPGNHDYESKFDKDLFNKYVKQNKDFPFKIEEQDNIFIIEESLSSRGIIQKRTYELIAKSNKVSNLFLLRHNISNQELIDFSNDKSFLNKDLPSSKELNNLINRDIFIISGNGGAFNSLPRLVCIKKGKINFIVNGLGGIEGDIVLVIYKKKIYKYRL